MTIFFACSRDIIVTRKPYIVSLQNVHSFKDILQYFKKGKLFFIVRINFGHGSSCYIGK